MWQSKEDWFIEDDMSRDDDFPCGGIIGLIPLMRRTISDKYTLTTSILEFGAAKSRRIQITYRTKNTHKGKIRWSAKKYLKRGFVGEDYGWEEINEIDSSRESIVPETRV